MIVLDTNVISELTRPCPDPGVVTWVDQLPAADVATSSMTVAELLAGIAALPAGTRRDRLGRQVTTLLDEVLVGRVLPFNTEATVAYAAVVAQRRRAGTPIATADAIIAATCLAHGARALATRNTADFENIGLALLNPWQQDADPHVRSRSR